MHGNIENWTWALVGGALVGTSSALLLALEGVNEGVSGMAAGLFRGGSVERLRRAAFLAGLACAGGLSYLFTPAEFANESGRPLWAFALAGLCVGYGARLANGCTSGHGVLGVSRGALRSVLAVLLFGVSAFAVEQVFPSRSAAPRAQRPQPLASCSEPTPCGLDQRGDAP